MLSTELYVIQIDRFVGFPSICQPRNAHIYQTIAANKKANTTASIYFSLFNLNFFILKNNIKKNQNTHQMIEKL